MASLPIQRISAGVDFRFGHRNGMVLLMTVISGTVSVASGTRAAQLAPAQECSDVGNVALRLGRPNPG